MCCFEQDRRITPQEMRSLAVSISNLDDSTTVTLGCLVHLTTHSLSKFPKHINTQPIYATARSMVSLYLGRDLSRINRVYAVANAICRTQVAFRYLQSIPL